MSFSVRPPTIRGAFFAFLALAFAPLVGFAAWETARDYREHRDAETRASVELARSIAAAADAFVVDIVRSEHTVAALLGPKASRPAELEAALARVVAGHPAVRDMSWLDREGRVVASTEPQLAGKSFYARDYFQDIAHGAEWRASPILQSVVDERATFIVARGIRDGAGALQAVVTAAIDADAFGAVILRERGGAGFTSIRDARGTLAAVAPARAVTWDDRRRGVETQWIQRALTGVEQTGLYESPLTGERRVGAIVPIAGLGWAATASRSSARAMAPVQRSAIVHSAVLLLMIFTAFAVALLAATRIVEPLRALEAEARRLAQGGEPSDTVAGPVEVRQVTHALRAMSAGLAERRRQLDHLQEERETLMRSVSHDLRTPLSVIVGHATLLERRADAPESQQRAKAILASAGRMTRLIGDLVDAARLDAGHLDLRPEPLDLRTFLVEWRDRVANALPVERVRVTVAAAVPAVRADPARLDQIVGNLVSNSLKYSLPGSEVRIDLDATPAELRLSVSDRGPGIPRDELQRVFERYYRVKGTEAAEGLGLGLFITRKLVEAHGWRIDVESELGKGTVFTIAIPVNGSPLVRASPSAA